MGRQQTWQVDWAGRHGTLLGTVNAALTVISAACLTHFLSSKGYVGIGSLRAATGAIVFAGVLGELIRAGLSKAQPPLITVIYRIVCWSGSFVFLIVASLNSRWAVSECFVFIVVLAVSAAIVGAVAAVLDDTPTEMTAGSLCVCDSETSSRNELAEFWEGVILKVCDLAVSVPNIEMFETKTPEGKPVGYIVEVRCPDGTSSWKDIERSATNIENFLRMGDGCGIFVKRGINRKAALVYVTEHNVLATDQPYPNEYGPLSIYDELPMMVDSSGHTAGPHLRSECMTIYGVAGSGKSNTAQVIGVGVARMTDALLFDIDTTGNRLSQPLLAPFIDGTVKTPAVCWSATDAEEAWFMLRAIQRAGNARNNEYGYLAREANDDKLPISEYVPQIIVRADEIAHIASLSSDTPNILPAGDIRAHTIPDLHKLVRSIVFDQRWGGIRIVLFGLRGTNEVIAQDIQAQIHVVGALKVTSMAEFRNAFCGSGPTSSLEDARWPGCIQARLEPMGPIAPYHVWRIRPDQIESAAIATENSQPEMDDLTRLALNGRDKNGEPFDDLYPGELDIFDTRWDRYFAKFGIERATAAVSGADAAKTVSKNGGRKTLTVEQAQANLEAAQENLRREVRKAEDDIEIDPADWSLVLESWGAEPYEPAKERGETRAAPEDWTDVAKKIISSAGADGIGPQKILNTLLEEHGIEISRGTLHSWLTKQLVLGKIYKPNGRHGKWAAVQEN